MTIFYEVHGGLYVNLTNRCPCSCTFCLRQTRDHMENSGSLWLEHEPTAEEIDAALAEVDLSKYKEVVFCGFGEPTERLDALLETAKKIRAKRADIKIRINTNGLGDLIHQKSIAPQLKGIIDRVSISLNTPNPERYLELTRSRFGIGSFDAMLKFAEECTKYVPEVVLTTVATTLTEDEEKQCADICARIGVRYRIRPWED
ncbi:MAG: TIGR04100 family radical SAM protein [Butyricicoccaceae bacterium]